jgi:hypothetical protein
MDVRDFHGQLINFSFSYSNFTYIFSILVEVDIVLIWTIARNDCNVGHNCESFCYIINITFYTIMPYLSKSGLLKVQDSKTYVFTSHDLKVQDSSNCPKVLKYGIISIYGAKFYLQVINNNTFIYVEFFHLFVTFYIIIDVKYW